MLPPQPVHSDALDRGLRESIEAMLELLMVDEAGGATVLVPQLFGANRGGLAAAILDPAPHGRRRILPGPPEAAGDAAVRRWHRDAWLAMSRDERESVVVAAGPGVASLAPLLDGNGEIVVVVHEPMDALALLAHAGQTIPSPKGLKTPLGELNPQQELRRRLVANPQARAILMSSPEIVEFTPTLGPPSDADRWRALLFEETMPQVRRLLAEQVPEAVDALTRRLGYASGREAIGAHSERSDSDGFQLKPRHVELLRQLNWLDLELYDYCTERGPN